MRDGVPPGGVVDGYRDEEEFAGQDGVHSGLMAPFSNRIRGGRYPFAGQEHDLLPGMPEAERLIYHGFEPVELMTDASNRPDCAGALVLEPGARREFTFDVEVVASP